jgi:hypothetical protein
MTGAVIALVLAALCALGVLLVIVVERRPERGWGRWLRESAQAWRSEELRSQDVRPRRSDVGEAGLEDLFDMGPTEQPAYTRPEDVTARLELARAHARAVRR